MNAASTTSSIGRAPVVLSRSAAGSDSDVGGSSGEARKPSSMPSGRKAIPSSTSGKRMSTSMPSLASRGASLMRTLTDPRRRPRRASARALRGDPCSGPSWPRFAAGALRRRCSRPRLREPSSRAGARRAGARRGIRGPRHVDTHDEEDVVVDEGAAERRKDVQRSPGTGTARPRRRAAPRQGCGASLATPRRRSSLPMTIVAELGHRQLDGVEARRRVRCGARSVPRAARRTRGRTTPESPRGRCSRGKPAGERDRQRGARALPRRGREAG